MSNGASGPSDGGTQHGADGDRLTQDLEAAMDEIDAEDRCSDAAPGDERLGGGGGTNFTVTSGVGILPATAECNDSSRLTTTAFLGMWCRPAERTVPAASPIFRGQGNLSLAPTSELGSNLTSLSLAPFLPV